MTRAAQQSATESPSATPTVTVRLPAAFHTLASGRRVLPINGTTVAEILAGLDHECPGVRQRILDDDGRVRRYVNIHRNDEDIRDLDGPDTCVQDRDVLWVIPAVAGG